MTYHKKNIIIFFILHLKSHSKDFDLQNIFPIKMVYEGHLESS